MEIKLNCNCQRQTTEFPFLGINKGLMYCIVHMMPNTLKTHFLCMLGYFAISIIYRTLIWTTGSFTCVCDLFACVYIRRPRFIITVSSERLLYVVCTKIDYGETVMHRLLLIFMTPNTCVIKRLMLFLLPVVLGFIKGQSNSPFRTASINFCSASLSCPFATGAILKLMILLSHMYFTIGSLL